MFSACKHCPTCAKLDAWHNSVYVFVASSAQIPVQAFVGTHYSPAARLHPAVSQRNRREFRMSAYIIAFYSKTSRSRR